MDYHLTITTEPASRSVTQLSRLRRRAYGATETVVIYDERYAEHPDYFGIGPDELLLEHWVRIDRRRRVLDLGAGQGRHALFLARQGLSVEAVDPSRIAVECLRNRAAEEGLELTVSRSAVENFAPEPGSYGALLLFGLAFKDMIETDFRSLPVIGVASIVFGLLLWLADNEDKCTKNEKVWNFRDAMIVGLAQAIALIPGTSRSGITMTAALMMGYRREAAARFSFLLSIPVIVLAGGVKLKDWIQQPNQVAGIPELLIGYSLSAVSAYVCIHFFLKYLEKIGMGPFVIYRVVLGMILLWMVY